MPWQVPVIPQQNPRLCWEACGRMLWVWRHANAPEVWSEYARRAGAFSKMTHELTEPRMDQYYRQLGLRSSRSTSGQDLRKALKTGPVIVATAERTRGHAMVVIGHEMGNYLLVDPSRVHVWDFGEVDGVEVLQTISPLPFSELDLESILGTYSWFW